ncbi:MAG TPA: pre-peptidase C-terminal domain-containing protein, partial [Flavobacteriales bacterium]
RQVGAGTWTDVTGLTSSPYALGGLTQGTNYEFQVRSVCSSATSAYSSSQTFTTPVPCPDVMEPNNSVATAATITVPANISALIASSSDVDYYKFTTTTTTSIFLSLSNLAGDYDLILRNAGGTQLAASENGGSVSESISYTNAAAGTYVVHVLGWNGAFSATQCYNLNASVVTSGCPMPDGVNASGITYTGATINWPAVQGASSYDLRYRVQGNATWTTISAIATNSQALSALTENTVYEMQVRSNCSGVQGGSSTSEYASGSFTTLSCDGSPSLRVAVKVFLDGAYRTADLLMVDALRGNLLPLQEPYTALGHTLSGARTTTAPVLAVAGNNAIVDWVVVELRNNTSPFAVVEAKAGLLQRDGDVVAVDGTSALGFCAAAGTYRVSVRHRNHLGVMTNAGVALTTTPAAVNFTLPGTATYGTNARRTVGSVMTLWAGNTSGNTEVKYTGTGNDRDPVLGAIGGTVPTNTISAYRVEDTNLDGTVKYTGTSNDRDVILISVGGIVPTNTVLQQLP